jgi:hypothetical protein
VTAELARQLIAQPEGEGIGFAVQIALGGRSGTGSADCRFRFTDAVAGIQNTEGQTIVRRFVHAHFKGDFANLRGGHGVLNQHQQNAAQGIAIAVAFVIGRSGC